MRISCYYWLTSLLLTTATKACIRKTSEEGPRQKHECKKDGDCPLYSYCFYSYWVGESCQTHYKREGESCKVTREGKEWGDHGLCRRLEAEESGGDQERFATSRCYSELGYVCLKSYFMPCTPDYDSDGNVIREDGCPEHFSCVQRSWNEGGARKVCVPEQPEEFSDSCEDSFGCGFSDLEDRWTSCVGGRCARVVE